MAPDMAALSYPLHDVVKYDHAHAEVLRTSC